MVVMKFEINGQKVKKTSKKDYVVNQSSNYLTLNFKFNEAWNGLTKYIIFKYKDKAYENSLTYDNATDSYNVNAPANVLVGDAFRFTVFGTNGDLRVTANEYQVHLKNSGFTFDISSVTEPDTDIFSQLHEEINAKANSDDVYDKDTIDALLSLKADVDHTHTSDEISDLENTIQLENKRMLRLMGNKIRTYGG